MDAINSEIQAKAYELIKNSFSVNTEDVLSKVKTLFVSIDQELVVKNVEIALLAHSVADKWPYYNVQPASEASKLTELYLEKELPEATDRLKFAVLNRIMRSWLY